MATGEPGQYSSARERSIESVCIGYGNKPSFRSSVCHDHANAVSDLCDRLKELFASGPDAAEATTAVASGRTRIAAAKARLALLRGKP